MSGMKDLFGDQLYEQRKPARDLFDAPSHWQDEEQREEFARVSSRIGLAVLAFVRQVGVNGSFYAEELRRFVGDHAPGAPGSPDRILRDLRSKKVFDYTVERALSRYTITAIKQEQDE